MKIRRLIVRNFRGIKNLEWTLDDDSLICLIGHGDSTKSTVLTAIEYVLYPKWNLQLTDVDFYECNSTKNPIEIEIVIGEIKNPEFKSDSFLSAFISYWNKEEKTLSDSAEHENCEIALKITLKADSSLEPTWLVSNEAEEEETIKYRKRNMFNMTRLDGNCERNFKWGYNTILSRLIEKGGHQEIKTLLAEAGRKSREDFDDSIIPPDFKKSANIISEEAKLWGTGHDSLKPYLDVFSADSLCLNDNYNVPIYMLGAGSKKLMLIAIEKYLVSNEDAPEDHIILLDEIENGLEPHRLIHVLFTLKEMANKSNSQVLISTHSPIALCEIAGNGTYRVKNSNGKITITRLDPTDNNTIRRSPCSYFLKKIIICEGKTEIGILRSFKKKWIDENSIPPEHYGTYFLLGEGGRTPKYAKVFKDVGYDVCVYRDSDVELQLEPEIDDFKYEDNLNVEQAILKDAPEALIDDIITFCENSERDELRTIPRTKPFDETTKDALAEFLHEKEVFRRIDTGESLGDMILPYWEQMKDGTFIKTIEKVKHWTYNQ